MSALANPNILTPVLETGNQDAVATAAPDPTWFDRARDYGAAKAADGKPGEAALPAGLDAWSKAADVFASARQANLVNSLGNSSALALQQAVDARNKAVKASTGQALEDPTVDGYMPEAMARFRQQAGAVMPDTGPSGLRTMFMGLSTADQQRIRELQLQVYGEKLADLGRQYPDAGLDGDVKDAARQLAAKAAGDAQKAYDASGGGGLNLLASLGGGMASSFRDPVQVGALFVPGGEVSWLRSIGGQMLESFLRQGAINAGAQAVEESRVQSWRKDTGQDPGSALEDIGFAGLFGGLLGAGFHGAGLARKALAERLTASRAGAAEAGRLADAIQDKAPETAQALRSVEADAEAASAPPPGVDPDHARDMLHDAAQAIEQPGAPLAPLPERYELRGPQPAPGALQPQEFDARVAARAAEIDPEAHAQARRLDADVARARQDVADNLAVRQHMDEADPLDWLPREDRKRALEIEEALSGLTGKRRGAAPAKAMRAELEALQQKAIAAYEEATGRHGAQEAPLRQRAADLQQQRAAIGQRYGAAMRQAEEEARAMGFHPAEGEPQGPPQRLRLAPEAQDLADAHGLKPEIAAEVAAREPNPAEHAALVEQLGEAQPRSPQEAAVVVSDAMRNRALPDAAGHLLGSGPPAARTLATEPPKLSETGAAASARPDAPAKAGAVGETAPAKAASDEGTPFDAPPRVKPVKEPPPPKRWREPTAGKAPPAPVRLIDFLKSRGGLQNQGGELTDLVRGRPGLVDNRSGLTLDQAREAAAEAGYLGGDATEAMANTTPAHLIEAIQQDMREPVYSVHDAELVRERELHAEHRAELEKQRSAANYIARQLEEHGEPSADAELLWEAGRIHLDNPEMEWDNALEQASMMLYHREEEARLAKETAHVPGSETGASTGAGEPGGGAGRGQPRDLANSGEPLRDVAAAGTEPGAESAGASGQAATDPGDVKLQLDFEDDLPEWMQATPVIRDGETKLVPRDEIGKPDERASAIADMIETCIL